MVLQRRPRHAKRKLGRRQGAKQPDVSKRNRAGGGGQRTLKTVIGVATAPGGF